MKNMKEIEAQRVKHQAPSRATNAHIAEEEQNGKRKRTKRKKERGNESPTQLPRTIQSPPTTLKDHTVSLFF